MSPEGFLFLPGVYNLPFYQPHFPKLSIDKKHLAVYNVKSDGDTLTRQSIVASKRQRRQNGGYTGGYTMKKLLALALAGTMTLSLAACGGSKADTTTAAETTETTDTADAASTDGQTYTVGICQLVQHEALDAATQGFKDAIVEALGEDNVTFESRMHRRSCYLRNHHQSACI